MRVELKGRIPSQRPLTMSMRMQRIRGSMSWERRRGCSSRRGSRICDEKRVPGREGDGAGTEILKMGMVGIVGGCVGETNHLHL